MSALACLLAVPMSSRVSAATSRAQSVCDTMQHREVALAERTTTVHR